MPTVNGTLLNRQADNSGATYSFNVPAGSNALLVIVTTSDGDAPNDTTVTYNAVSVPREHVATGSDGGSGWRQVEYFYLQSPATGLNDLVFSRAAQRRTTVFAIPLADAGTLGTFGDVAYASTSSPTLDIASVVGDLVFGAAAWRDSADNLTAATTDSSETPTAVDGEAPSRGGVVYVEASSTLTQLGMTLSGSSAGLQYVGVAVGQAVGSTLLSFTYQATATPVRTTQSSFNRAWSYAASGSMSHARTSALSRAFAFAASGAVATTRSAARYLAFAYSAAASVAEEHGRAFVRAFAVTASGALSLAQSFAQGLARTYAASGAASLVRVISKSLSVSASGAPVTDRSASFLRSFSVSAVGSSVRESTRALLMSMSMTATAAVAFAQQVGGLTRSFALAASASVATALQVTFNYSASATAVGTSAVSKMVSKAFAVIASAASSVGRGIALSYSVTATATSQVISGLVSLVSRAFTATGTADVNTAYTPASEAGITRKIRTILGRLNRLGRRR